MKNNSQLELFDDIFKQFLPYLSNSNNKGKINLGFLYCLIWAYHNFRISRPTINEQTPLDHCPIIKSSNLSSSNTLYIFPSCDFDMRKDCNYYESRFFNKVTKNLPSLVKINFHQIIRDHTHRFSKPNSHNFTIFYNSFINKRYFLKASMKSFLEIFRNLWFVRASLPSSSIASYFAFFRALVNFYSNFEYFQKLFIKNRQIRFLVVSNFYSPENLGLILAANKFNIESFDIQHGVKNNVVAYERIDLFPTDLRPTKFINWAFNISSNLDARKLFREFFKGNLSGKKCLVTLQPSNSEDFIMDLEKLHNAGLKVFVRPHPRRNSPDYQEKLRLTFGNKIIISRNTDLFSDFLNADLHLSEYSSSLIESASTGLLSIALHSIAKEYFLNEIKDGKILCFSSITEFLGAARG